MREKRPVMRRGPASEIEVSRNPIYLLAISSLCSSLSSFALVCPYWTKDELSVPVDGYSSKKDCEAGASSRPLKEGQVAAPGGPWVLTCLPDTVDPRGPKAK